VAWGSRRAGTLDVWVAPLAGGPPRPLTGGAVPVSVPCWSPDGRTLAVQVRRGDDVQVGLVPSSGGGVEVLTGSPGQSWPHSFSPDGSLVAFAGLRGGVWNLFTVAVATRVERPLTSLARRNAYARYPAFSPKGDRVVFEYGESAGNVWTAETAGRSAPATQGR
jgi:Tol biopolymer transport system component